MQDDIQTYVGVVYERKTRRKVQKVVALDLDETIGSFSHLHILWNGILKAQKNNSLSTMQHFFKVFDLFPEFLRDYILKILMYLYNKRKTLKQTKLFLYTNNQCNYNWTQFIIKYLEYKMKIKEPLFNHTVGAFKIRNCIVEPKRTSNKKLYSDFVNCTLLPKSTEICFIDNSYHQDMVQDKIYYIQPRSYYHNITLSRIIDRFYNSPIGKQYKTNSILKDNYKSYLHDWFEFNSAERYIPRNYNPSQSYAITKKIMYHIKEFFYHKNKQNTRKSKRIKGNFTRKLL